MSELRLKKILYQFCQSIVEERLSRIQNNIADIQQSLTSETKSSAGDKHETGRAMLQLEREKLGRQLAEAEKMKQVLSKVPVANASSVVGLGSLVKTSEHQYYLSISAGEYKNDNTMIFCISTSTPIGRLLLGKAAGATVAFNGRIFKIKEIQ